MLLLPHLRFKSWKNFQAIKNTKNATFISNLWYLSPSTITVPHYNAYVQRLTHILCYYKFYTTPLAFDSRPLSGPLVHRWIYGRVGNLQPPGTGRQRKWQWKNGRMAGQSRKGDRKGERALPSRLSLRTRLVPLQLCLWPGFAGELTMLPRHSFRVLFWAVCYAAPLTTGRRRW